MSAPAATPLAGVTVRLAGGTNPVVSACESALGELGCGWAPPDVLPDILLVAFPLLPDAAARWRSLLADAGAAAEAMQARGAGRIVFLLPAVASLPMRRHAELSREGATAFAALRGLAMDHGPAVLVNAVGCGYVDDGGTISGDPAMLDHMPIGRPVRADEIAAAVIFFCNPLNSYATGQMLTVDGGWSAGYGRHF